MSHSADEETKAHGGEVVCLGSWSWGEKEPELEAVSSDCKPSLSDVPWGLCGCLGYCFKGFLTISDLCLLFH